MTVPQFRAGYLRVGGGTVARTIDCGQGVLVDVDASGRILGVETVDHGDFYRAMYQALLHLKVASA